MSEGTNGGPRSFIAPVFLTDDEGVFTFVCPNVDVIFGYVPDEVRAMTQISTLLGESLFDRAELAAIDADRVSLQQVMLNLMLNGMDAMDQLEARDRRLVVSTRRLDENVEVAVSDSGHGIPADRLPRLFDAFFTTKKEGLGGATFRLTLPAMPLH